MRMYNDKTFLLFVDMGGGGVWVVGGVFIVVLLFFSFFVEFHITTVIMISHILGIKFLLN